VMSRIVALIPSVMPGWITTRPSVDLRPGGSSTSVTSCSDVA
jgi:hypothetical protein